MQVISPTLHAKLSDITGHSQQEVKNRQSNKSDKKFSASKNNNLFALE